MIITSISRARERDKKLGITEPEHVRPWLQAFTLGKPAYGAAQLEAQKKAVYDSGYDGWVMWNPGSIYDVVHAGAREDAGLAKEGQLGAAPGKHHGHARDDAQRQRTLNSRTPSISRSTSLSLV